MRIHNLSSLSFSTILLIALLSAPLFVHAENGNNASMIGGFGAGLGLGAILGAGMAGQSGEVDHPTCVAETERRRQKKQPPPNGDFPCVVPASNGSGTVTGVCFVTKCRGKSFTGVGGQGGGGTGLDQVMKSLGELFGKLMQQPPSTPSASTPPTSTTNPTGCQGSYFQTSDISQIGVNPCAQYVAPVSGSLLNGSGTGTGVCDPLSAALGTCGGSTSTGGTSTDTSTGTIINLNTNTNTDTNVNTNTEASTSTDTNAGPAAANPSTGGTRRVIFAPASVFKTGVQLTPGARGDIKVTDSGATVVAGTRDTQNNVEVAGFYGAQTFGGTEPQGLVGQWCQSRPWANNFLSKIVAPSFFDGLCSWRGYQVGSPPAAAAPQVTVIQQTVQARQPATTVRAATTTSAPAIPPRVDIWAVPASVPLGARTSIFWNTQGVTNCTETSPDGSFNQSSLSGGAATVAITGATTFTISCLAPDGSHVTAFVTVNLKI